MIFSIYDIAELMIQDLVTLHPPGNLAVCTAYLFSPSGITPLNSNPIHIALQPVTLTFTVENTRHAFLSRIGLVEVVSGIEKTVDLYCEREGMTYALSVENPDGLVSESRIASLSAED